VERNHLTKSGTKSPPIYTNKGQMRGLKRVSGASEGVPACCVGFVRNAASRPAPSREFGGRAGRRVDGSPPELARRVRKAPAMIVCRPCPRADLECQQAPSGPENPRSSGNATTRELSTVFAGQKAVDDYCRCFADPPGRFWRTSINHAPGATPELSRWCRA